MSNTVLVPIFPLNLPQKKTNVLVFFCRCLFIVAAHSIGEFGLLNLQRGQALARLLAHHLHAWLEEAYAACVSGSNGTEGVLMYGYSMII